MKQLNYPFQYRISNNELFSTIRLSFFLLLFSFSFLKQTMKSMHISKLQTFGTWCCKTWCCIGREFCIRTKTREQCLSPLVWFSVIKLSNFISLSVYFCGLWKDLTQLRSRQVLVTFCHDKCFTPAPKIRF